MNTEWGEMRWIKYSGERKDNGTQVQQIRVGRVITQVGNLTGSGCETRPEVIAIKDYKQELMWHYGTSSVCHRTVPNKSELKASTP